MSKSSAEHWLAVPGYEGPYAVSDEGRVNSSPREGTRGGILKPRTDPNGYAVVTLWRHGQSRCVRIHTLVMEAFRGQRPRGLEVRHLNGDPQGNWLANLVYGTHGENLQDIARHGRNPQLNRTHCPQGHEYDEENTRLYRGQRYCKRCAMLATWKQRGKEPDSPRRRPAPRTHCRRGHEFTPENTYRDPAGHQHCRACKKQRSYRSRGHLAA